MTRLYALDLRLITTQQWSDLLPTLPEDRQRRVLACRQESDRVRTAGAARLLQLALEETGIPVSRQRFTENPWGRPELIDREDLHFSLSHSGHWAVCAVADTPVGVDVEQPRCTPAMARRFFHPDELRSENPIFLTRLWTAKEAFLKALGRGLTVPLDSFLVHLEPDTARLEQDYTPLPYRLHEYRLEEALLCLCTVDHRAEIQWVDCKRL